jgi:hypothetical protein
MAKESPQLSYMKTSQGGMSDTQFMTADEKRRVLRDWETFLKNGCRQQDFTKALYYHLIMNCSFIAHYDLAGFYETYFIEGDDTVHFLEQFDRSRGCRSIELGMDYWLYSEGYHDINGRMVEIAAKYIPALTQLAESRQRKADIARAELLLAKHGLKIRESKE